MVVLGSWVGTRSENAAPRANRGLSRVNTRPERDLCGLGTEKRGRRRSGTFSYKHDTNPEGGVTGRDAHEDAVERCIAQAGTAEC